VLFRPCRWHSVKPPLTASPPFPGIAVKLLCVEGKRPYHIPADVAHHRGVKAGKSRTTPDYYLRKLAEAAGTLTDEQVARLAALLAAALAGAR
jgi:hypothetical protein